MNRSFIFYLIIIVFAFSCKKTTDFPENFNVKKLEFKSEYEIKDILLYKDSTIYICGGKKGVAGFIYRSEDNGNSWDKVMETSAYSVNALYYGDTCKFWAAGDSIALWKSSNGLNWNRNPEAPCYWNNCRNPYHDIKVWDEHKVFAVGGEYFQRGILSYSETGVSYWLQHHWDNQLNDLIQVREKILIAAYGMVIITNRGFEDYSDMDIYGANFITFSRSAEGFVFLLSEEGKIYKLNNEKWDKKEEIKGRFRDFDFNSKYAFAVGDGGVLAFSDDSGNSWNKSKFINDKNLSVIKSFKSGFLTGTRDGFLYFIKADYK